MSIKNIGKVSRAQIELNGITVMAGSNNTGKSTIGKVLFCLFNGFYKIDQKIRRERNYSINSSLHEMYGEINYKRSRLGPYQEYSVEEEILKRKDVYITDKDRLVDDLRNQCIQVDKNYKKRLPDIELQNIADKIIQTLNVSDDEILLKIFRKQLQDEFKMQINNVHRLDLDSEIMLNIKEKEVGITIRRNELIEITGKLSLNNGVTYMDDPFALNGMIAGPNNTLGYILDEGDHRVQLRLKLVARNDEGTVDRIITERKLEAVFAKINSACVGDVKKREFMGTELVYQESDSETALEMENVSTGIKMFAILKTLLKNGSLKENSILILDEPEVHVHPEWQLLFAEVIVLLQKEFNLYVLLNTHSHYFLEAIDVFSRKYDISEKCKYYLAENDGKTAIVTDVSDNLEKIYYKLARPLQVLENERYPDV
ncbi:MAG: ATP-binding protein [Clostridiales Family XIII bacterium]|nr:ATP-binding protein [Clostridiales Family XIII bacterium]